MVDAADEQLTQQPAFGEKVDEVVEQLLRFFVGGAVDDAFRIDNAIESAQRVETALLEREQTGGEAGSAGHCPIVTQSKVSPINIRLSSFEDFESPVFRGKTKASAANYTNFR